jgi:hypothetical protein
MKAKNTVLEVPEPLDIISVLFEGAFEVHAEWC